MPIHQKQLRESSPSKSEEKVVVGVKYFKDLEPLIFTLQDFTGLYRAIA
ncbi:MAG: hypothetical protein ACK58N_00230 [Synechocystis sp.]